MLQRNDNPQMGYVQYLAAILSQYGLRGILDSFMCDKNFSLPELPPGQTLKSLCKKSVLDHENTLFAEECRKNSLNRTLQIEISLDSSFITLARRPRVSKD
jgi:hypothetical protein